MALQSRPGVGIGTLAVAAGALIAAVALFTNGTGSLGAGTGQSDEADLQALAHPDSLVNWVGPPTSLDAALGSFELVVVGRIQGPGLAAVEYPSGYDPETDTHLPEGVTAGMFFTDYTVVVDEYLQGDGPARLTLRLLGDLVTTEGSSALPRPVPDAPMILYLNPHNDVWMSRGPWGLISAHEGVVSYAWRADDDLQIPRPVPYFEGLTLEESVEVVRGRVADIATSAGAEE
ncbi:MAG: hypothetical protein ACSLFM_03435 [Tepidiformaceae bacterium]